MKYLLLILAFSLGVLLTLWRDNYLLTRDNGAVDWLSKELVFYENLCMPRLNAALCHQTSNVEKDLASSTGLRMVYLCND